MHSTKHVAFVVSLALCSSYSRSQSSPPIVKNSISTTYANEIAVLAPSVFPPVAAHSIKPVLADSLNALEESSSEWSTSSGDDSTSDTQFTPQPDPKPRSSNPDKLRVHPFSTVAVGAKISTLGAGFEVATPFTRSLNLRSTANYAIFSYGFNIDGIDYGTRVDFRSAQVALDWFPFHGGFHLSPGFLYFKNGLGGSANVPAGKNFTLQDVNYINSVDDPVSGTASIVYSRHMAPTLTLGWGNIIPRSGRHLTFPFEIGAAYTGPAVMDIKLAGTACTYQGCFNAATDPDTQANLQGEIKDINDTVKKVPVFPIISFGVALRF